MTARTLVYTSPDRCARKQRFGTVAEATLLLDYLRLVQPFDPLHIYRCNICAGFHVGHRFRWKAPCAERDHDDD